MLKRGLSLVIAGTMVFSIYACSSPEADNKDNIADEGISGIKPPIGCEIVDDMEKFENVTDDQTYNKYTDAGTSFDAQIGGTDTESALYVNIDRNWFIYCDKKTGNSGLLCGKPDCDHRNNQCNAYMAGTRGVEYYNGYLYTVVEANGYKLVKMSVDGSQREEIGSLMGVKNPFGSGSMIEWEIHRGYIYYCYCWEARGTEDVYYLNNSNCIYRMALEKGSEPECIMPLPLLSDMVGVEFVGAGSYMYMIIPKAEEKTDVTSGSLYRYNAESGKLEYFKQFGNKISGVAVCENKIYYSDLNRNEYITKVYCYDMETKDKSIFVEINGLTGVMPYDDDYIYITYENEDNIWKMSAWDWNGVYVFDIPIDNGIDEEGIYKDFGGSDDKNIYMWCLVTPNEKQESIYGISNSGAYTVMKYIEKEDISDGEYEVKEWSEIAGKSE